MRTRTLLSLALAGAMVFPAAACSSNDTPASPSRPSQVHAVPPPADPTDGVFAVSFADDSGFKWCGYYDDYDSACSDADLTGTPIEIEDPTTDNDTGWYETTLAWPWFLRNMSLFDHSVHLDPASLAHHQQLFADPTAYALVHHLTKPAKKAAVRLPKTTRPTTTPPTTAPGTRTVTPAPRISKTVPPITRTTTPAQTRKPVQPPTTKPKRLVCSTTKPKICKLV